MSDQLLPGILQNRGIQRLTASFTMGRPALRRGIFAILFLVPVLGKDKFRLQRNDGVISRCSNDGGDHSVRIGV